MKIPPGKQLENERGRIYRSIRVQIRDLIKIWYLQEMFILVIRVHQILVSPRYNDEDILSRSNLIFKFSSSTDNPINIYNDEQTDKTKELVIFLRRDAILKMVRWSLKNCGFAGAFIDCFFGRYRHEIRHFSIDTDMTI